MSFVMDAVAAKAVTLQEANALVDEIEAQLKAVSLTNVPPATKGYLAEKAADLPALKKEVLDHSNAWPKTLPEWDGKPPWEFKFE